MAKDTLQNVNTTLSNPGTVGSTRQTFAALSASTRDYSDGVLDRVKRNMKNTAHRAKSLSVNAMNRSHFDPENQDHRVAYAVFLKTGRWVQHFYTELPSNNVPSTIDRKLIKHALSDVNASAEKVISNFGHLKAA